MTGEGLTGAERGQLVAVAGRIVHDRLAHYGYQPGDIAGAMLPIDHKAAGCTFENWNWDCYQGDAYSNHPLQDEGDSTAEFVCWVLEHPAISELVASRVAAALEGAAADEREVQAALRIMAKWAEMSTERDEARALLAATERRIRARISTLRTFSESQCVEMRKGIAFAAHMLESAAFATAPTTRPTAQPTTGGRDE